MNSKKIIGKGLLLVFTMLVGFTTIAAQKMSDNYSSLIVLKVEGLNADSYNKLAAGINKEVSLTLEYSCLESDIIVIKCKHTYTEKGDVQHFINSKLKKWISNNKVEFIYLDLVLGGSSKC